ncbi:hypothetical protein C8Q80DRAFT_1128679 [Daedaleopsis nitida]|nr:hypothetical protein C8Q80DRAFT_1128679 [Daedaleopsis nitida]
MVSRLVMLNASEAPAVSPQNFSHFPISRASSDAPTHLRPATPSSTHSSSSETGDNDIIPPYDPHAPRTLVLCFDGTGDQFDSDNSNVVKFFSLLKRDDRREQMVYYQTGIGTYTSPQLVTSAGQAISKTLDEMVAWNLADHVMGGYEFLMQNYEAGDKVCLFGFSRGAYTARALAGMVHKVGLLPAHNRQQIPFAYRMYSRTDALGWKQSTAFKKVFSIDIDIEFIGVWDTVCSVGVVPRRLPFTASNTAIRTFRHALSLDERRAKFRANHYQRPSKWEREQGTHPGDMPRPTHRSASNPRRPHSRSNSSKSKSMSPSRLASLVKHMTEPTSATTTVAATAAVATPSGTVEGVAAAVGVEKEKHDGSSGEHDVEKEAAIVVEAVAKDAEAAVDIAAQAVDTAAKSAGQAGSKLWQDARSRFDTLRTLMRKKGKRLTEEEQEFNKGEITQGETDVKEVWFAGCHCDVGGGSVLDTEKHSLARIPLRWMIRECFRTNTGIRFHAELLKEIGLDPATLWPISKTGIEYGPGLAHAPQIPPLLPSPRISFDPPTPAGRPREDVEQRMLHAVEALSNANGNAFAPARAPAHMRHVSVSTTRTLVGTMTAAPGNESKALYPDPGTEHGHETELSVNEEEEERRDAICPIYDQLALKPWWWLLELLPIEQRKQLANNKWKKYTSVNLGRGRIIPPEAPHFFVHRSVKMRMEAKNLPGGPYKPRAIWGQSMQPIYVD